MREEPTLETKRLVLRPFRSEDAVTVFQYRNDPNVMKFIPGGVDETVDETRAWFIKYREHQQKYGFSKLAIVLKQTGRVIGDSGLLLLEKGPDFELGYRLASEYWGMGLATESGHAWLDAAFSLFGLQRVVAFAHPENAASIRVMVKLGMTLERRARFYGMDSFLYAISREIYVS